MQQLLSVMFTEDEMIMLMAAFAAFVMMLTSFYIWIDLIRNHFNKFDSCL